jgi:hypothetical protein
MATRKKRQPKSGPPPLETVEGAEAFALHTLDQAVTAYARVPAREKPELPLVAYVLMTTYPETNEPLKQVQIGQLTYPGVDTPIQHRFVETRLQEFAKACGAIGVLICTRAVVEEPQGDPTDVAEMNDFLRQFDIEVQPVKRKVVLAHFEHVKFGRVRTWEADVLPEGKLGVFVEQTRKPLFGRFLSFLN